MFFPFAVLAVIGVVDAFISGLPKDGRDLAMYISRPDIRAPKLVFNVSQPEAVAPGYWFMTTSTSLDYKPDDAGFTPLHTGPHIFDNNGELVWSGAALVRNRVTHDFKVAEINGSSHLSLTLSTGSLRDHYLNSTAVILDSAYATKRTVENRGGEGKLDMHEFNIINLGQSVLTTTHRNRTVDVLSDQGVGEMRPQVVDDNGFQDIDLRTGQTLFEWWPLDHVDPFDGHIHAPTDYFADYPWDMFHVNSVDKDSAGDYLVSSRSMSAIYKICGKTGAVIWQLGGKRSDFVIDDKIRFAHQYDARYVSSGKDSTVISLLNNVAVHSSSGSSYKHSTAQIIRLDTTSMTAHQSLEIARPDGYTTNSRGNFQTLPGGNRVVGWSGNGLLSEHTAHGDLVLQGCFTSDRFTTFHAYKFQWKGAPSEQPALAVVRFGQDEEPQTSPAQGNTSANTVAPLPGTSKSKSVTVAYVSWNGATDVDRWQFFADKNGSTDFELVGDVARTGFETECVIHASVASVYARAISASGSVLSTTDISQTRNGLNGEEDVGSKRGTGVLGGKLMTDTKKHALPRVAETTQQVVKKQSRSRALLLVVAGFTFGYVFAMYK